MSDTTPSHPGTQRPGPDSEVEELALLFPEPASWDLPRERHRYRKELLMNHIDADRAAAAATPPATAARVPRRLLRPAVLAPATALALAAALTVALTQSGGSSDRATRPATAAAQARPTTVLLDRISDVALLSDTIPVKDTQFVYIRSISRGADETSGKAVTGPLEARETWLSQVQGPVKKLGLIRQDGETLPINAELGDTNGTPPGLSRPTYRWLAALPTDPGALLAYLYAHTPAPAGRDHDQAVFERIGDLIAESVMPPRNAAALYKAAARIPGVVADPAATDATGRHGIGIRRDDTRDAERSEWVFDAHDLSFLGSRTYLTRDTAIGGKGALLSADSVMERAVVDRAGLRPTAAQVLRTAPGTAQD